MRCLMFVLCACSTPQPPARIRTPDVKPQVYCPGWQTAVVGELFPGCGDLPLAGIPCGRAVCDRPCSVTVESTTGPRKDVQFTYDADGRYVGATGDASTCTYDRGRRVRCASPHESVIIERDARGRIVKLLEEHDTGEYEEKPVTYDARGRVTHIGKAEYEYDASGQLRRYDGHTLVWKDRFHVEGNWLGHDATFVYDERDRLAQIELPADNTGIRFTWEEARLAKIVVWSPDRTTTSTYRYCDQWRVPSAPTSQTMPE